jgi:hypothetical protein
MVDNAALPLAGAVAFLVAEGIEVGTGAELAARDALLAQNGPTASKTALLMGLRVDAMGSVGLVTGRAS